MQLGRCCFSLIFILVVKKAIAEIPPYVPPIYPQRMDFIKQVCNCPNPVKTTPNLTHTKQICSAKAEILSSKTHNWLNDAKRSWNWINDCKRPEAAFRQSVLLPDKTQLLAKFAKKLNSCSDDDDDDNTISIVVFGGSVTTGQICPNAVDDPTSRDVDATDYLNLPTNLSIPLVFGDKMCPWSNNLFTMLKQSYPKCKHIDIYNLAHHATDHAWALDHMHEYFHRENGARGGLTLANVVDLVLVDYSVNDGLTYRATLDKLKLESTENNMLGRVEALTEYFIQYILQLPNHPALLYIESGSPQNHIDAIQAHYDAARRYGIPMASMRHVASYPDNPSWVYFNSVADSIAPKGFRSHYGYYHDINAIQPVLTLDGKMSRMPLKEGPIRYGPNGEPRDHKFIACWSMQVHPRHSTHNVIAQMILYYITIVSETSQIMHHVCKNSKNDERQIIRNKKQYDGSSEYAKYFNDLINPFASCPFGPITEYDSETLYNKQIKLNSIGLNLNTAWDLVQDRPHKYGFIIESSQYDDPNKNIIKFNLNLSEIPQITIEYMHSYENAGKVEISLEQQQHSFKNKNKRDTIVTQHHLEDDTTNTLTSTTSLVLDAYEPSVHNALYAEYKIKPMGYDPGPAVLVVKLVELTAHELKRRGGNRFKLVSTSSC